MGMRAWGPVAGVVGGLCWVIRWVADLAGHPPWGDATHWAGLALLGAALAVVGAGLVSKSALWLRVVVAVAFPVLVWALYWAVRGAGDAVALDGAIGLLAVVLGGAFLAVVRRSRAPQAARHGSHAAR